VVTAEPPEQHDDLVSRLVDGDETALGRVYDLYSGQVYALAARVTRDDAAAEDVTQEVFVHLWLHPTAFDPDRGTLRNWLATLAHRRAVDCVRREEARRRRDRISADHAQAFPDPADGAITGTLGERVRAALSSLPDEQRATIMLAYFDGMTYREVARALNIPEGTAKSRIRMGMRRLASQLRAEGIRP
jgi:RNA polymerase sigma factor (sigma-70 family)